MRKIVLRFILAALFVTLATACDFEASDLGTLPGGADSWAYDVNEEGVVVGASETASGQTHATRWNTDGSVDDLGTLGGANSWAYGVNNLGVVVGRSETSSGDTHAFFAWGNTMISLGPGVARAINDANWMTGDDNVWKAGVPEELDDHPQKVAIGYDITESNQVGGTYLYCDSIFRWDAGVMHGYPTPDVYPCTEKAFGINESGWMAGRGDYRLPNGDLVTRATLFRPWGELALDHYKNSVGYDINDFGWIVGTATTDGVDEPFVWFTGDGTSQLLPTLGGDTGEARRANKYGVIVGWSEKPNGHVHATRWDPRGEDDDKGRFEVADGFQVPPGVPPVPTPIDTFSKR